MIKPLDIVKTPNGGIALVTECTPANENVNVNQYSVDYITNPKHERNAWWQERELTKLSSLTVMIAKAMCHPFGLNEKYVEQIMNPKKVE